ncbi:MAG: hypothetical protein IT170_06290 [Bryobacterales bacterium]|nr:hypothetical protein [Bryobacterales bacterium]
MQFARTFSPSVRCATRSLAVAAIVCSSCAWAEEPPSRTPLPSYLTSGVSEASAAPSAPVTVASADPAPAPMLPVSAPVEDGRIHRSVPAGAPYRPLATKEKSKLLLLSTFQPETLARISFTAGLAALRDSPNEWPRTVETYNWRFADRVGQRLVYKSTEFLVGSVLLHEDPRYYLAEQPGVGAKVRNALKQTWMTRRDNGSWAPAWGAFAGAYTTGVVGAQWMPDSRQTAESILIRSSTQIGFRFCNNLLREFGPTLRKKFRR